MKRTPLRRKSKRTGFPRSTIARAIDRDQWCVMCGLVDDPRALTGHHRLNRGHGGSTALEASDIRNCLALCWPCNGLIESSAVRAQEARERGVKLRHGDPLDTPVIYPDGRPYVLTADGQRRPAQRRAA